MKPTVMVVLAVLAFGCGGAMRAPRIAQATDDQSLAVRVRTALLNDPVVHANEITVSAQNGVIVLRGRVHDTQEANAAMGVARRIEGVKDVQSELQTNR